jgi:hypothetical protein
MHSVFLDSVFEKLMGQVSDALLLLPFGFVATRHMRTSPKLNQVFGFYPFSTGRLQVYNYFEMQFSCNKVKYVTIFKQIYNFGFLR